MSERTSSGITRVERLTKRAVDEVMGDDVPPELRQLAIKQLSPWAERLVKALDETLRIPGTNIHIGLDPILGFLIPGAGDALTGAGSMSLLLLAWKERLPTIAILRMVMNIAIDTLFGALPFVGDAFDMFFRSNRRNFEILKRYRQDPKAQPSVVDHLLVGLGLLLAVASIAIPIVLFYWIGWSVIREL